METLATTAPTPAAHAEVLGLLAATLADAGQFGPALRRLETTTDAPSALVLAHRDAVLARWITSLDAANDGPGVAVLYARHHLAIDTRAASPTARQVARALMDLGLAAPALRLLRLRDPGDDPGHALAIAEAALANQDLEAARAALTRVTALAPAGELALSVTRLQARLAAAEGRPERVAMDAVVVDADLAATLGRAWVARGDAAVARGDRTAATQAYEQARRLAPDGPMALAASAGLVQLRAGVADESALASLARSDEPILQRAVMLLGHHPRAAYACGARTRRGGRSWSVTAR